ncbi:MAG: DNA-formamidopyrimidine glycosylase family protein [Vicinamibacterales bacterium]
MPELPDIELYLHALRPRLIGHQVTAVRIAAPFLVRTVDPAPDAMVGRRVTAVGRLGKRLVIDAEGVAMVLHLMIAGRLRWRPPAAAIPRRLGLAALDVASGALIVTEAGTTRRASLHMARGADGVAAFDPGGLEPLAIDLAAFTERLTSERHTLKRALTDPTLFAGIGNAYSDEILHRAGLSPMAISDTLDAAAHRRLFDAVQATLAEWREALIAAAGDGFPEQVTAFRPGMRVHGRFGQPCPACGAPVQRIRYAANEANYCPGCQTGGRLLADRGLSRLLKGDWPRTVEQLEQHMQARRR